VTKPIPAKPKIVDAHCNKCVGTRRHDVLHEEATSWSDEIDDRFSVEGGDAYEMLRCCGCGEICLRHRSWFSEDIDEHGGPAIRERCFPPRISRRKPDWLSDFKSSPFWAGDTLVEQLLEEIYEALHSNSRRLAAMGVRALIEHVMIDNVGDKGTFAGNLEAFTKAGHISVSQKNRLGTILEAGHASIHRDFRPSADDLKTLLDITESVIADVYVHGGRAEALGDRIPPRVKAGKAVDPS